MKQIIIIKIKKIIFTIVLTAFTFVVNAQVGIGTTSPDASAQLDVVATNKGFLPPRVSDVTAVANPVAGLLVYDQSYNCMRYYNGSIWSLCLGDTTGQVVTSTSCGGKIWMDRNLGASQVATSLTDAASYGGLYQWGRAADGHESRTSLAYDGAASGYATTPTPNGGNAWDGKFITTANDTTDWLSTPDSLLWQGVNGANNPCPSGYRLPTQAEFNCELNSWTSQDRNGGFTSPLKIPAAGLRRSSNNVFSSVGADAHLSSSTIIGTSAVRLWLTNVNAPLGVPGWRNAAARSVRCIKD